MPETDKVSDLVPETKKSEIIDSVPLRTLISVIDVNVKRMSKFQNSTNELVQTWLKETPTLEKYVQAQMKKALTPKEAKLVGETSLVVFEVARMTPPVIEELDLKATEGKRITREDAKRRLPIEVIEDDIYRCTKDKNSIYLLLQEDICRHPALATYVAQKMSESVNLEEANLIGQTALVVYQVENYILSFPLE